MQSLTTGQCGSSAKCAQVVESKLTCIVAASKDKSLAKQAQRLFASESMRINLSTDVTGVEVCGALKNVLAIAAGIVEGKGLGSNALAAVVRQHMCPICMCFASLFCASPCRQAGDRGARAASVQSACR